MKIMGLDISTHAGVSVIRCHDSRVEVLAAYEVSVPKGLTGMRRAGAIAAEIMDTLEEHTPDEIILEGYGFSFKGSAIVNVEITAVVKYFLYQKGYEAYEVSPTSLKQFITGKGNADKNLVMKELYKKFGIDTPTDNVADAVSLSLFLAAAKEVLVVPRENMVPVTNWLNPKPKKIQKK